MKWLNNILDKKFRKPIDSSQLSYDNLKKGEIQVSKVTNHENKARKQYVVANNPALKSAPAQCVDEDIINIQLLYDTDHSIELEL